MTFAEAERATPGYPWFERHPYPGCFVCGPAREPGDGLRILPGAVAGREIAAAPWVPGAIVTGSALFAEDGAVRGLARATWIVLR